MQASDSVFLGSILPPDGSQIAQIIQNKKNIVVIHVFIWHGTGLICFVQSIFLWFFFCFLAQKEIEYD